MAQVVIASRLSDGLVVFLREAATPGRADWVLEFTQAEIAESDSRAAELLAVGETDAAERHTIVDPYLIDVKEEGGAFRPTKYREAIRCFGPSIRLDLGKRAESAEK